MISISCGAEQPVSFSMEPRQWPPLSPLPPPGLSHQPLPDPYPSQEFYGGADIVMETAVNGQLKEALEVAMLE